MACGMVVATSIGSREGAVRHQNFHRARVFLGSCVFFIVSGDGADGEDNFIRACYCTRMRDRAIKVAFMDRRH